MKKTKIERQTWSTGVLSQEVIEKDIRRGSLPGAIVLTIAAVALGLTAWPLLMATTDMDLKVIALLVGSGVLSLLAYRQWWGVLTKPDYRIEEDRIVGKQMQIIYEDKDAEVTGMATRIPVLELENHGSYRVVAEQIHTGYREYELYHILEEGEGLYLVYGKKDNKLLRIYRKKYWTLE